MKQKLIQVLPSLLLLLGYFIQNLGRACISTGCVYKAQLTPFAFTVFTPLYWLILYTFIPALLLIFVSKQTFHVWLRLLLPWAILSLLVYILLPGTGISYLYSYGTEDAAKLAGILFSIGTIAIILWSLLKKKLARS